MYMKVKIDIYDLDDILFFGTKDKWEMATEDQKKTIDVFS